jgi:hypothetical protein
VLDTANSLRQGIPWLFFEDASRNTLFGTSYQVWVLAGYAHAMSICAADTVEFSRGKDRGILVLHMALEFWWRKLCSDHVKSVFLSLAMFVDLHLQRRLRTLEASSIYLSLTPRACHCLCVCSTSRSSAQPGPVWCWKWKLVIFSSFFPVSYPPTIVDLRHSVQVCFNQALPCFSFFSSQ